MRLEKFWNAKRFLILLDVTALFTNVPTDLAIDDIAKRWKFIKFSIKIPFELMFAIRFVLSFTFFMFNNIIYKQTFLRWVPHSGWYSYVRSEGKWSVFFGCLNSVILSVCRWHYSISRFNFGYHESI